MLQFTYSSIAMTSFSESEPVFVARCLKVGLSETDVAAFKAQGIRTLANVAFMSSYTPGAGDDAALMRVFEKVIGELPPWGNSHLLEGSSTRPSQSARMRCRAW